MTLIEGHDQRITRLENLSIKLVEQNAQQNAQFEALGKQIANKLDAVSDHVCEKIELMDSKVKSLETGVNRDKARLMALEDSKKVQQSVLKWFKRYIFPIITAAASLSLERLLFHHH